MTYQYHDGPIGPQNDEMLKAIQNEIKDYQHLLHQVDGRTDSISLTLIEAKEGVLLFPRMNTFTVMDVTDNEYIITQDLNAENAAIVLQDAIASMLIERKPGEDYDDEIGDLVDRVGNDAAVCTNPVTATGLRNLCTVLKAAQTIAGNL